MNCSLIVSAILFSSFSRSPRIASTFLFPDIRASVNELNDLKCNKRAILSELAILVSSYAPHIAEELWQLLGDEDSITYQDFPEFKEEYIKENSFSYPVSFNGKMRFKIDLPIDMSKEDIEKAVLEAEEAQKWIEGKTPRKVIVVPKKIVNIVI